ncbi:MAG: signal recognition particle-docking protein FtsY [Ignavibacteriae bacterium]|nr:MAG: signal recognition particle-docking protein FtsY [Ignavibacteriota bacterium]
MGLFDNLNFSKLKTGLTKTRNRLVNSINETLTGKSIIDDETIDQLEEILLSSDIGALTADRIIENVRDKIKNESSVTNLSVINTVKEELVAVLSNGNGEDKEQSYDDISKPFVILVVGVNGVGKTTTIGKLAYNFNKGGTKVIIGAADTFRAAASEQLDIWAERAGVEIIQKDSGADPSSVAFETVDKAVKENYDFVIIDTAGRLHNKVNLMNELGKLKRAISKILPGAPHETLLILDGTIGQNALVQAEEFAKVTEVNGLVITKLDGTAKGGAVFQICSKMNIPIKYIGVGEKIDDLQNFDSRMFVDAIFQSE